MGYTHFHQPHKWTAKSVQKATRGQISAQKEH